MLNTKNLYTSYGELSVVKDVNINVEKGELISLFGPNGHGKTTLLKTICGLIKPKSGEVNFNGSRLDRMDICEIVERGIVYVPEDRNLFTEMTVMENLIMGTNPIRARDSMKENLDYVFQLFPKLERIKDQLAGTLSGGEARMLTVGRGIMSNPEFMAIDEPSLGLAPNLRVEVFNSIKEIQKRGVSVFMVEQSTSMAAEIADRVYLMEEGQIVYEGEPSEVFSDSKLKQVFFGL
ncbi:MAG: ABC transporter ATP-binding protein [Firmicutes bacterium]|nr:ABC transporter ATP-binding protein [Bacillota bacterium]